MIVIAKVVILLSYITIMFCFDGSKETVGTIALVLLTLAIEYILGETG